MKELRIDPENVQVDIGDGVQIRLLDIHSEFEQFNWFFKKDTFPRMQDKGESDAEMVDLSAVVSDIIRYPCMAEISLRVFHLAARRSIG